MMRIQARLVRRDHGLVACEPMLKSGHFEPRNGSALGYFIDRRGCSNCTLACWKTFPVHHAVEGATHDSCCTSRNDGETFEPDDCKAIAVMTCHRVVLIDGGNGQAMVVLFDINITTETAERCGLASAPTG